MQTGLEYIRPLMKTGNKKLLISFVAVILLGCLYFAIFSFSEQDGETSGSLSYMISEKCVELLNVFSGKHWTRDFRESLAAYFEHPIRKLAHFAEYACMGVLVSVLLSQWMQKKKSRYLLTTLWVFLSAAADEIHQLFVPGRYGSFADVCLDTCGGIFGMLFLACVLKIFRKHF